jgi:hypothetical protein
MAILLRVGPFIIVRRYIYRRGAIRLCPDAVSGWTDVAHPSGACSDDHRGGLKARSPATLAEHVLHSMEKIAKAGAGCQSALNSFQVTASKSFHLIGAYARTDCLVDAGTDAPGFATDERLQSRPKPFGNSTA